jgi:WD40 repeat protein
LDRDGFFGEGGDRQNVILNVVYGDMSDEQWLAHAQRLNSSKVVESSLPYLQLHLPSGPVSRWGGNAYQVTALSLSLDRSLVAYSGSGGEVGVLRVADRKGIYEKRGKGQHWASALSPDGTRLFLGDSDGVGVLETWTGKYESFVKTGNPAELALSSDGKRLAVSTWDEPLRVFDTATGNPLWKQDGVKKATLSFSPCGRWLAAASACVEGKTWVASVTCYEASTGRELWTTPLGNGSTASIAWSPDGEELLGSASEWVYSDRDRTGVASLSFFSAMNGGKLRGVPWRSGIDAVAVGPGGQRIALCSDVTVVILNREGAELARGTGGQESLDDCAFVDDDTVLAVGRDVNSGPAILSLTVA